MENNCTHENCSHKSCCGNKNRIKVENHSLSGGLWCIGWLFTIGYLHLAFWEGVLALILWPYYLGVFFAPAFSEWTLSPRTPNW